MAQDHTEVGTRPPPVLAGGLEGLLDTAVDAIIAIDQTQRIRLFNRGAEAIFGYRAEEVLGRPLEMLLPASSREAHRGHVRGFAASAVPGRYMGDRGEIRGRRKDGSEFPAEAA